MTELISKLDHLLKNNHYLIFLLSLLTWICIIPIFGKSNFFAIFEVIVVSLVLVSSIYFFHMGNRKLIAYLITPLALLLIWIDFFSPQSPLIESLAKVMVLLVLFLITNHLLVIIIKSKEVIAETIYAAIGGYLMIGIMSAIGCWFILHSYPTAYNVDPGTRIIDFVYYTIVTMSTLGYGDIVPQIEQSKSMAILITIIGQFYMAVLMALLIGKYLSKKNS